MNTHAEFVNRLDAKNEAIISEALRTYITVQQLIGGPLAEAAAEEAIIILFAHETAADLAGPQ